MSEKDFSIAAVCEEVKTEFEKWKRGSGFTDRTLYDEVELWQAFEAGQSSLRQSLTDAAKLEDECREYRKANPYPNGKCEDALECSKCEWKGYESEAIDREDEIEGIQYFCPWCDEICAHVPIDELDSVTGSRASILSRLADAEARVEELEKTLETVHISHAEQTRITNTRMGAQAFEIAALREAMQTIACEVLTYDEHTDTGWVEQARMISGRINILRRERDEVKEIHSLAVLLIKETEQLLTNARVEGDGTDGIDERVSMLISDRDYWMREAAAFSNAEDDEWERADRAEAELAVLHQVVTGNYKTPADVTAALQYFLENATEEDKDVLNMLCAWSKATGRADAIKEAAKIAARIGLQYFEKVTQGPESQTELSYAINQGASYAGALIESAILDELLPVDGSLAPAPPQSSAEAVNGGQGEKTEMEVKG